MNLYNFFSTPEQLFGFKEADMTVPQFFWRKYSRNYEELQKRETAIATDALCSYKYAHWALRGPFPLGEATIATNAAIAYNYAWNVLKRPFLLGEKAIYGNRIYARLYNTLKHDVWRCGE